MSAPSFSDSSLYEIATGTEHSHPLQISPITFKSMLSTIIDVFIEEDVPAVVWAKLPRGNAWQYEIERYQQATAGHTVIYQLMNQHPESDRPSPPATLTDPATPSFNWDSEADVALDLPNARRSAALPPSSLFPITLASQSQLRREYFWVVRSPRCSVVLLAHRPRSVRPRTISSAPPLNPLTANTVLIQDENDSKRKHLLFCVYSFTLTTVQAMLGGLHQAIKAACQAEDGSAHGTALLQNWQAIAQPTDLTPPDLALVSKLHSRQIFYQEEVLNQASADRKLSEQIATLQLKQEELANKLRIKDEFLKSVGQEMRTPLTNMKTALTLLESNNLRPAQRQRYMELLINECDRQSSLITSVLDLLHLEDHAEHVLMQPIRLADVVPGVVSTYQPLAQERGIMLAYTVPNDLPAVSCLKNWLRQMMINLLHNAIKFTPKGGEVWVRAKQQGDYIQLECTDTGVGIAPNELPTIFQPFQRSRSGQDDMAGSGLGLSIVQQLAINCGGSVSVQSKPGEGATFNVLLPIYNT